MQNELIPVSQSVRLIIRPSASPSQGESFGWGGHTCQGVQQRSQFGLSRFCEANCTVDAVPFPHKQFSEIADHYI